MVSGNVGLMKKNSTAEEILNKMSSMDIVSEKMSEDSGFRTTFPSETTATESDIDGNQEQDSKGGDDFKDNIFSSRDLPLDTSSTRSQLNSSSQSSASSPVKKKTTTRIAARFNKAL